MLLPSWLDMSLTLCLLAIAIIFGLPADPERPYRRQFLVGLGLVGMVPYLDWRCGRTLSVYAADAFAMTWAWTCLTVEILAFVDMTINLVLLSRSIDRRPEADRAEAALRQRPLESLPWVDVFIVTYDEPLLVLEKTIFGALSLDYPRVQIWVLDDGERHWLADFCTEVGVNYLARPTHEHKKAGNQNYALQRTTGEFIVTLDADFIPYPQFIYRVLGFFEEPTIALVQTPQCFYNADQFQLNLSLSASFPDEQRVFFSYLLPCRDAWGTAMYAGSCAMIRRSALEASGGFYEGTDIEDLQTGLRLNYHGHKVIYLNERLSVGLVPESLHAFFEQRKRWCRGCLQLLWLKEGPLGLGVPLMRRLFFLPIYWMLDFILALFWVCIPVVLLLTGYGPYGTVSWPEVLFHQASVYFLSFFGFVKLTRATGMPMLYTAFLVFQSFKLLPTVIGTFLKPFGKPLFKIALVTPKGNQDTRRYIAWDVLIPCLGLMILTVYGMWITQRPEYTRVFDFDAQVMVFLWALISLVILGIASLISIELPYKRAEERFETTLPVQLTWHEADLRGTITDMSLLGCGIALPQHPLRVGQRIVLHTEPYGEISARVCRTTANTLGVEFLTTTTEQRRQLSVDLFTNPHLKPLRLNADSRKAISSILQHLLGF